MLSPRLRRIAMITAITAVAIVILLASLRPNNNPDAASNARGNSASLGVPAVPKPVSTGTLMPPATIVPSVSPIYSPLPASPGIPTRFPTYPVPSWTPVPIGSDDKTFNSPTIPPYTTIPDPTHRPDDPFRAILSSYSVQSVTLSTKLADTIVIGTVKQVGPARWTTPDGKRPANPWAAGNRQTIFTPVLVTAETYLEGTPASTEVLLWSYGGTVGQDWLKWEGDDRYTFQQGDQVVVFLSKTDTTRPIQVLGNYQLWQIVGHYTIKDRQVANVPGNMTLQQLTEQIKVAQREAGK